MKDSREEESTIRLAISDGRHSFCVLHVSCAKYEDSRNRLLVDVTGSMKLEEGPDVFLEDFPIDQTLLDLKGFRPIVTAGSRYWISEGKKREMIVERTLEVELQIYEEEPTLKELEEFEYSEVGGFVSDSVGLLLAFYQAAKRVPISA